MAVSDYSGGEMRPLNTQAPITPVNTTLINTVGALGEAAINYRKMENEAVAQEFMQEAGEYFRNQEQAIATDPVRTAALKYGELEYKRMRGAELSEDDVKMLAGFKRDFDTLENALFQGRQSELAVKTRAQQMLNRAVLARPDLGDELRKVATQTLGSEITGASSLAFSESLAQVSAMAKKQAEESSNAVGRKLTAYMQFKDLASDKPGFAANMVLAQQALAEGDVEKASQLADKAVNQFIPGGANGKGALAVQEYKSVQGRFRNGIITGEWQRKLLNPDEAPALLQQVGSEINKAMELKANLEALDGIQRTPEVEGYIKELDQDIAGMREFAEMSNDPARLVERLEKQKTIDLMGASADTKFLVNQFMPQGKAEDVERLKPQIIAASAGDKIARSIDPNTGYVDLATKRQLAGTITGDAFRFSAVWPVAKAATPEQASAAARFTAQVLLAYGIQAVDKNTGTLYAPERSTTLGMFQGANQAAPNMLSQLESQGTVQDIEGVYGARALAWDNAFVLVKSQLPEKYRNQYLRPNTYETGFETSAKPYGWYEGDDIPGFKAAFKKALDDTGIATYYQQYVNDQLKLSSLIDKKSGARDGE